MLLTVLQSEQQVDLLTACHSNPKVVAAHAKTSPFGSNLVYVVTDQAGDLTSAAGSIEHNLVLGCGETAKLHPAGILAGGNEARTGRARRDVFDGVKNMVLHPADEADHQTFANL